MEKEFIWSIWQGSLYAQKMARALNYILINCTFFNFYPTVNHTFMLKVIDGSPWRCWSPTTAEKNSTTSSRSSASWRRSTIPTSSGSWARAPVRAGRSASSWSTHNMDRSGMNKSFRWRCLCTTPRNQIHQRSTRSFYGRRYQKRKLRTQSSCPYHFKLSRSADVKATQKNVNEIDTRMTVQFKHQCGSKILVGDVRS